MLIYTIVILLLICFVILIVVYQYIIHNKVQIANVHKYIINKLGPAITLQPFYDVPTFLDFITTNIDTLRNNSILLLQHKKDINYLAQIDTNNHITKQSGLYTNWTFLPLKFCYTSYAYHYPTLLLEPFLPLLQHRDIISVSISYLAAHKHITTHNNPFSGILRYQLPLVVKGKCTITVLDETKKYVQDQAFVFDDHLPHSVYNDCEHERIALLIDIARPYSSILQTIINNFTLHTMSYFLPIDL